jgi:hypothetical protein
MGAIAAFGIAAALISCGRSGGQGTAVRTDAQRSAAASTAPSDPDMVTAVSGTSSTTPIGLKFRLEARPLVGQPMQIVLELTPAPNIEIDQIHTDLQPSDGLLLQSERAFDIPQPTAGVPVQREVTVTPQQTGLLEVTAQVDVDTPTGSISRNYAIPLIAGDATH